MRKIRKAVVNLLVLVGLFGFSGAAMAGNLQPPAAPNSTMKTLDEVEPRTPIPGSDTPAGVYNITKSGSYYLTGNREASGTCIIVDANDVSIDLAGFSLVGPDANVNYGVYISDGNNIEVRNGTVKGFYYGIYQAFTSDITSHRVIDVRAVDNGYAGIYLSGYGNMVKSCSASGNNNVGIYATDGSTVIGNNSNNNGGDGIYAGNESYVAENTATRNGGHGIVGFIYSTVTANTSSFNNGYGIYVADGCTVSNNTVSENEGYGIMSQHGCTIINNTVYNNNKILTDWFAGIRVSNDCQVKGNTLRNNSKINIRAQGSGNSIENNLIIGSTTGIYFFTTGNFYSENRLSKNTADYYNSAGQTDGGGNTSF